MSWASHDLFCAKHQGTFHLRRGGAAAGAGAGGGAGGGGSGGQFNAPRSGGGGGANTGSGAGGSTVASPASGGSGHVVLKMLTSNYSGTTTGTPTVSTDGSYTILTYGGTGTYTG